MSRESAGWASIITMNRSFVGPPGEMIKGEVWPNLRRGDNDFDDLSAVKRWNGVGFSRNGDDQTTAIERIGWSASADETVSGVLDLSYNPQENCILFLRRSTGRRVGNGL